MKIFSFAQDKSFFINRVLNGMSQIMLQENRLTGILFLSGIFYGSIFMGIGAILGVITSTTLAQVLKFDKDETDKGMYGFSPALVGVAMLVFLKPAVWTWALVAIGSVVSALIQNLFIKIKLPVFTLPFVLVTWGILFFAKMYLPELFVETPLTIVNDSHYFTFPLRGYGQVIFQENTMSGILFFLGVFINSPVSALYGLAGAVLTGTLAVVFLLPTSDIALGLFSYNAVLCAIAFSGTKKIDGVLAFTSIFISFIVGFFMFQYNLTRLTFPFVAGTWGGLILKQSLKKK
ncbi:MAG: urea transporter [Leptospiraceae bacterium]|nr:urea transporter [Leptospiraceae bacterium]MCK6380696.1 urea transporter [Leptospiraceae bacterium]NUM42042.1 urea transporter [Leptospiraceae bacterium]